MFDGRVAGLGSGVLVDAHGLVLTVAHVVQTAESVEVEFANGETIPARVLTSEPMADVALLELERPPAWATRIASAWATRCSSSAPCSACPTA